MSDIPPELIEEAKRVCAEYRQLEAADRLMLRCWRWFVWLVLALAVVVLFSTCAHAATLDRTDVYCELFQQDPDNGRYYIVADPPWTPDCANPWVTLRKDKFQTLVDTYEGGASSTPQFTADEVAAIKYQLANPSPFNLSLEDGAFISVSIGGVWVIAWGFKQLGRFGSDDPSFE